MNCEGDGFERRWAHETDPGACSIRKASEKLLNDYYIDETLLPINCLGAIVIFVWGGPCGSRFTGLRRDHVCSAQSPSSLPQCVCYIKPRMTDVEPRASLPLWSRPLCVPSPPPKKQLHIRKWSKSSSLLVWETTTWNRRATAWDTCSPIISLNCHPQHNSV